MSRHVNIPVFIPHLGCPNQCVFCNQRTISGVQEFDPDTLVALIDGALATVEPSEDVEIAFFGGSFTGIDRDLMLSLLRSANTYIKSGRVKSIRCSTRPDYINDEILRALREHGVKDIELGLQSVSPRVLTATKRGHSFEDAENACRMIVDAGFDLTGQMMIGLPGSTPESELDTAEFIISSGCKSARIYPTVVFKNTELCEMSKQGIYKPLDTEEAVRRSAAVLRRFVGAGIKVIRIGLCASDNLISDDTYFDGPNHPALGELVENELYYSIIYDKAREFELEYDDTLIVGVAKGFLSKAIGQRKRNKLLLTQNLKIKSVRFEENAELSDYEIVLRVEKGENKCI